MIPANGLLVDAARRGTDEYRLGLATWLEVLENGGVTAFPTDTVWGIGALAASETAVERVYQLKRRSADQPLACLVSTVGEARRWAACWPPAVAELVARHWPGALTVVLPTLGLPFPAVQRGVAKLGLRVPDRPVLLDVLSRLGQPLAATSANVSGQQELPGIDAVRDRLGSFLDLLVDDNVPVTGTASTVVEWDGSLLRVIRCGKVHLSESQGSK
ncbi:MAG: threonylcarbamoyl-AMP synthase [Candidatus Riflebacteria bacterium]|nr:threonylcarbamoyl-AMP synthase [Candidatus Riflebacteria bacterium]